MLFSHFKSSLLFFGLQVVVWSKSYCPYCTKTKTLFETLGVKAKIYELDERKDGANIQASLLEMTGQRTVPSVFINGKHIGGNDDTQGAAKSGELQKMLGIAKK
jgi:glutaredoxin 3